MILDNEPRVYILQSERGIPDASEFMIRAVTGRVATLLSNLISFEQEGKEKRAVFPVGDARRVTVENCIVGWKNIKNAKGEDVKFDKSLILELPPQVLNEIYDAINEMSTVRESEAKN